MVIAHEHFLIMLLTLVIAAVTIAMRFAPIVAPQVTGALMLSPLATVSP